MNKKIVAAGPFTTSDNLEYEPLVELLDYARKKQPNLILLVCTYLFCPHLSAVEEMAEYPSLRGKSINALFIAM